MKLGDIVRCKMNQGFLIGRIQKMGSGDRLTVRCLEFPQRSFSNLIISQSGVEPASDEEKMLYKAIAREGSFSR